MVSEVRLIFSKKPVERGSCWFHSPLEKTPHKAGVVGDRLISAAGALIPMAAERRRPAAQNGVEYLDLSPAQELTIAACEAGIGSADDIGNLKAWPRHGDCSPAAREASAANRGC